MDTSFCISHMELQGTFAGSTDWTNLPADNPYGLIMECDVECPQSVHDYLQDLPQLPECQVPPGAKCKIKKLLTTLVNKTKYVFHYRVWQKEMTKNKAIMFSQSQWMSKFIHLNATLRAQSTDELERNDRFISKLEMIGKVI